MAALASYTSIQRQHANSRPDITMSDYSRPDIIMSDYSPHKRKRSLEDTGDRDPKKMHLEESRSSVDDLHLNVGAKYLLCQTRKPPFAALFLFRLWSSILTVAGDVCHAYLVLTVQPCSAS